VIEIPNYAFHNWHKDCEGKGAYGRANLPQDAGSVERRTACSWKSWFLF